MKLPKFLREIPLVPLSVLEKQQAETHKFGEIADTTQIRLNHAEDEIEMLKSSLAESEDQRERMLKGYEAMEFELNNLKAKYGIALKQIDSDEKDRARKEELALDVERAEFAFLRQANPQLITEIMALIDRAGKYVAAGSLKIRTVEGIAYRDGAFDGLKVFKAHVAAFLPAKAKKP